MSEFNKYGTVGTMFENVMTHKPHAKLRAKLADPELAKEAFSTEIVEFHRSLHSGVEDYEERMRSACVDALDGMIGSLDYKAMKLREQLAGIVSKTDELRAIRTNITMEGEQ